MVEDFLADQKHSPREGAWALAPVVHAAWAGLGTLLPREHISEILHPFFSFQVRKGLKEMPPFLFESCLWQA